MSFPICICMYISLKSFSLSLFLSQTQRVLKETVSLCVGGGEEREKVR